MNKIYRTSNNEYVTLVAHRNDLQDAELTYYGLYEYSLRQDVDSGEWDLNIFDLGKEERLDSGTLSGISWEDVHLLLDAAFGRVPYANTADTDGYYERIDRFAEVLEDEVLMKAIAAEYAERD